MHSHGSLRLDPGSSRVARTLTLATVAVLVVTVVGLVLLRPTGTGPDAAGVVPGTEFVDGTVEVVEPTACPTEYGDPSITCATATVVVTSGTLSGDIAYLPVTRGLPGAPSLEAGDRLRPSYFAAAPAELRYSYVDHQRRMPIAALAVAFALAVVLLSRFQGVRALLGMVLSLVLIVGYLLPALLRGGPPVPLALATASAVAMLALYLAHGVHVGTHVAFIGAVSALLVTTGLGSLFVAAAHLSGFGDEDAVVLTVAAGQLDLRGLVLAGLVIGALGVLDDVTVTQVSAVAELQSADPGMSAIDLYRAGLRIGRDHVASTVNTLVLAYVGAGLPLLLLFSLGGRSFFDVLLSETVAVEVIRALVGSIGLVAAVPITTGLAAWVVHREQGGGAPGHRPVVLDAGTGPSPGDRITPVGDGTTWPSVDDGTDFWDRR